MKHEFQVKLNKDGKSMFKGNFLNLMEEVRNGNNIQGIEFANGGVVFHLSKKPIMVSDVLTAIEKAPEKPEPIEPVVKKPEKITQYRRVGEYYEVFLPDDGMDYVKNVMIKHAKPGTTLQNILDDIAARGIKDLGRFFLEKQGKIQKTVSPDEPNLPQEVKDMIKRAKEAGHDVSVVGILKVEDDDDEDPLKALKKLLGL